MPHPPGGCPPGDLRRNTQGEASGPAVGFRTFEVPACLLLRAHGPTWGDDEHAPQRWHEAALSWLALHPERPHGAHLLQVLPRERLHEPTRAEVDTSLRWAGLTRADLPAVAAQARALFPSLFDRDWLPQRNRLDDDRFTQYVAALDP